MDGGQRERKGGEEGGRSGTRCGLAWGGRCGCRCTTTPPRCPPVPPPLLRRAGGGCCHCGRPSRRVTAAVLTSAAAALAAAAGVSKLDDTAGPFQSAPSAVTASTGDAAAAASTTATAPLPLSAHAAAAVATGDGQTAGDGGYRRRGCGGCVLLHPLPSASSPFHPPPLARRCHHHGPSIAGAVPSGHLHLVYSSSSGGEAARPGCSLRAALLQPGVALALVDKRRTCCR